MANKQLLKLSHDEWGPFFLKYLNDLRQTAANMCDAKILLQGNESISAHSCVLAAVSPFFRSILQDTEYPEIDMSEFPVELMKQIVDFMYTGEILLSKEEVPVLHSVADTLSIHVLVEISKEVLSTMDLDLAHSDGEESPIPPSPIIEDHMDYYNDDADDYNDDDDDDDKATISPQPSPEGKKQGRTKIQNDDPVYMGMSPVKQEPKDVECDTEHTLMILTGEENTQYEKLSHEDAARILNSWNPEEEHNMEAERQQEPQLREDLKNVEGIRPVARRKEWKSMKEPIFFKDRPVPVGTLNRAKLTLPQGFHLDTSSQDPNELGVFMGGCLRKNSTFGPYEGYILAAEEYDAESDKAKYCWQVYHNLEFQHWIDGSDESQANWMRYVRRAPTTEKQNIEAYQNEGQIHFRSMKDIQSGEELLTNFGNQYSAKMMKETEKLSQEDKKGFQCQDCDKMYSTDVMYWKHRRGVHSEVMPVEIYKAIMEARAQNRIERDQYNGKPNTKNTSDDDYDDKDIHECIICNRRFKTAQVLKNHAVVHMAEKPIKCEVCGRGFTQKGNLKLHMFTHTGERPHVCNLCGRGFSRPAELKKHVIRHQGHRPFKCDTCDKGFSDWGNLHRHKKIHTGEKPFKCHICGKGFAQSANLRTHTKRHTGEKPYKCSMCDKCFGDANHLRTHLRRHTGEKPFHCEMCGKGFVNKQGMIAHAKRHTTLPKSKLKLEPKDFVETSLVDLVSVEAVGNMDGTPKSKLKLEPKDFVETSLVDLVSVEAVGNMDGPIDEAATLFLTTTAI